MAGVTIEDIEQYIENGDYDRAIRIVDQNIGSKSGRDLQILYELRFLANCHKGDESELVSDFARAYDLMMSDNGEGAFYKYSECAMMHGETLCRQSKSSKSSENEIISFYKLAKEHATDATWQSKFQEIINEFESILEIQKDLIDEEENDKKEEKLTKNQIKKSRRKQKKKAKESEGSQGKKVEEESQGKGGNKGKEVEEENEEAPQRDMECGVKGVPSRPLTFDATFSFNINVNGDSMRGQMRNEQVGVSFPHSLVRCATSSLHKLQDLRELCASHEGLLSFFHVVRRPEDDIGSIWLVVEPTYTFDEFFTLETEKFLQMKDWTMKAWWEHIAEKFKVYFRDVVQALRFLYVVKDRACGDLSFNFYVTEDGRARIRPSMDLTFEADLRDLILQMKRLISFCFESWKIDDAESYLPDDLTRLFSFVSSHHDLRAYYLIDLPFFWSIDERISYLHKLKSMMYKAQCINHLETQLVAGQHFADWGLELERVYGEIWKKGDPSQYKNLSEKDKDSKRDLGVNRVYPYQRKIDIVRFFVAVYHHANDEEYSSVRGKMRLSDEDIEKDLSRIFPTFYTSFYECVG